MKDQSTSCVLRTRSCLIIVKRNCSYHYIIGSSNYRTQKKWNIKFKVDAQNHLALCKTKKVSQRLRFIFSWKWESFVFVLCYTQTQRRRQRNNYNVWNVRNGGTSTERTIVWLSLKPILNTFWRENVGHKSILVKSFDSPYRNGNEMAWKNNRNVDQKYLVEIEMSRKKCANNFVAGLRSSLSSRQVSDNRMVLNCAAAVTWSLR